MGNKETIIIDYLSQPEVFAELFNGYVFGGKQVIQPEDLHETDGRLRFLLTDMESKGKKSTYEVIKRERDIVREVIVGGRTARLAVFGVEHQSEIDYSMVLRTLTYDTLEYLKQAKAIEREHRRKRDVKGREFLSGFKKEDELLPTITIVFYTGKERWDAARDLKGLFGASPYLEEMLPLWLQLHLISSVFMMRKIPQSIMEVLKRSSTCFGIRRIRMPCQNIWTVMRKHIPDWMRQQQEWWHFY